MSSHFLASELPLLMALSDLAVRNAKPGPKPRKLYDERGLFLLVNPTWQPSGGG